MRRYVNMGRLIAAAALLAGLFAGLGYLQSRGGDGDISVQPARVLENTAAGLEVGPEQGKLAPDFEASGFGDRRLRLSELRGSPVVVKFWATWCSSCLMEFEHLREIHRQLDSTGLRVVAVNTGESYGRAKEYADFLDAPFDWALDPSLTIADAYRVIGFPVSVFVDPEGVVQALYVGEMDEELMREYTQAAIDAAPAPEAPFRLRFVNTLPREHVLLVRQRAEPPGQITLVSQRFRCDAEYCLEALPSELSRLAGVRSAEYDRAAETPELVITYQEGQTTPDAIVAEVKRALDANPDPLYRQPLQVTYEREQG